jgi:hypothetical protein
MELLLQIWGGGCYLLNKIFLSRSEGKVDGRTVRIWGWAVYLLGLPAWVIILVMKRDWMAATIEAGGAPAMLLGLMAAMKGLERAPRLLTKLSEWFAYALILLGIAYSLYDYHGLTAVSQLLEIGVMAGFLIGTDRLAKHKTSGWLWFMVMNTSMGLLMWSQANPILAGQQLISLCFVISGYCRSLKTAHRRGRSL